MRKIEQAVQRAVADAMTPSSTYKLWHQGNMTVRRTQSGSVVVTLHGNDIWCRTATGRTYVTCAGWVTRTTASRLTALGTRMCIKNGVAHINGQVVDSDKWYSFKRSGDTLRCDYQLDIP